MSTQFKYWEPYVSPFDPCPPIRIKSYSTPPNLYMTFQPTGLAQFQTPREALHHGTLWPELFSPYPNPHKWGEQDG
ncbi:spore coat associated protein CotJA [Oceanobacillus chungangensis]|uniref:Spore coat protein CotJA n=1 Tax=Oceanobacillus chungangensis TaxID=1229152 RepID=A0A3D8PUJ2_9BACI|nr:spore coat associated protein CotJA [Oceanobacillus chungangensis]RDW19382.1 spore coat protein CotJA [Oceanobacillus chungangensis]